MAAAGGVPSTARSFRVELEGESSRSERFETNSTFTRAGCRSWCANGPCSRHHACSAPPAKPCPSCEAVKRSANVPSSGRIFRLWFGISRPTTETALRILFIPRHAEHLRLQPSRRWRTRGDQLLGPLPRQLFGTSCSVPSSSIRGSPFGLGLASSAFQGARAKRAECPLQPN